MTNSATAPENGLRSHDCQSAETSAESAQRGWKLFVVAGEEFFWEDILLAAAIWGEWPEFEKRVRGGIACAKHAEATGRNPGEAEIEAAANEFRYQHDLISAEETETWLGTMQLGAEAWLEQIRRALLQEQFATSMEDLEARYPTSESELEAGVHAALVCGGDLARWAKRLAGRAAIRSSTKAEPGLLDQYPAAAEQRTAGRRLAERLLVAMPDSQRKNKIDRLIALEAAYLDLERQALTPAAIQSKIDSHFIDWTRFRCRIAQFATEEVAREAALCVRQDGDPLSTVVEGAGGTVRDEWLFFDKAPTELRNLLLGARPGSVLGPLKLGNDFALVELLEKHSPSQQDAGLRQRAATEVLATAVAREIGDRVRWLVAGINQ